MTGEQRLLAACRRESVDSTPVWFMRQAGRCLEEYRELRKRYDMLTLAKTPELAAQVTSMPIEALGVDGAVIFADIMLPMESMGAPFVIEPEVGPIIHDPVRSAADVARLRIVDAEESTPYVFEAIRLTRQRLGSRAALIGFSGAPFTLACYLVEGRPSRDFPHTKALMFGEPAVWNQLMDTLVEVIIRYLRGQIAAGAQVIQLFDSWVGALAPSDYEEYVLPHSKRIFDAVRATGVPSIHFGTGNSGMLEQMAAAGCDLVSVDWRVPLDEAWGRIGDRGIHGNLDPTMLLAPYAVAEAGAADVLRRAAGRSGHVFNLGHGVLPATAPDALKRLVDFVHESTSGT
ncbi:MAG: uroporphyrinogen decarboxylase [Candidatus Handelsmanbacteria bacterium RIFCSPLOWO2_12_FULL_64_10]|uniref:Uroporphyrinogen decarboxylase n=1 Tax=Handelsmanbacteria sp. (strain RIFCSPLOWO2_12_FULL_64_10) TaxID=1817868 RepID=A0A1F6CFG5_HANXR|nr:MAG: uroporphyrinogen decarboxylase [Candidatus Handelsmanbacteria bacterium RIFCSPLOWO2_12_FULL_64_10]